MKPEPWESWPRSRIAARALAFFAGVMMTCWGLSALVLVLK